MVAFNKKIKVEKKFEIRGMEIREEDDALVLYVDEIHPLDKLDINFVVLPSKDTDEDCKSESD